MLNSQANELEHERKSFTTALEERSRVLQLSTSFHTRAEAFLNNCTTWETSVRHVSGTSVNDLNQALRLIQVWIPPPLHSLETRLFT